jgi:putative membrane protein
MKGKETFMSRRGLMSLMTIVMLASFVFASPMQQSDTQSSPTKQDKSASSSTKSDKHDHSMQNDKHSDSMHDTMSGTTLNSDDRKFIMNAAHGGMMEVKLGHLAADKATDADVKQFGQRMVDDHSKANSELMALASQKGITLPASSDSAMMNQSDQSSSMSSSTAQSTDQQSSTSSSTTGQQSSMDTSASGQRHARVDANTSETLDDQKAMNKLSGLSGDAFDREYINMMVKDHEKDVKEFEKASMKAKDPDVRAFAAKTLPTLREHLQQVRDIQNRMKSSNKSTSKT